MNVFATTILPSIIFTTASLALAQKPAVLPQDTLARVGSIVITARDLLHRIESVPFSGSEKSITPEVVKERALHAMIAEKLLGHEAKRLGLPNDKQSKLQIRELENLFIRDELYKRVIVAKATVSGADIAAGLQRLPYELKVLSFLVRTRAEGEALSKRLHAAKPGNVLNTLRGLLYSQVDTITIRFGGPDTAYETAAYAIGRSRVSEPLYSVNCGWAVLCLLDKQTVADIGKWNVAKRRHQVEKILRERHEAKLASEYYFGLLQAKHAKADERTFNLLADSLIAFWKQDTAQHNKEGKFVLSSGKVELMIERLLPFVDSTLIRVDEGNVSLGETLEMFRYEEVRFQHLDEDSFKVDLNEAIKHLTARELLAREGRRQNVFDTYAVQNDLQLWTDYLAAAALYNRVRDSVTVSDEDIIKHLVKNKDVFGHSYEVNVREVLRNTVEDMKVVLDGLQHGRTLADLASEHSTRTEWVKTSGESGYFQVADRPEIGFRALMADSGETVGPVQLPEGYSVFMVLGKRRPKEAFAAFDMVNQNVRVRILTEKRKRSLNAVIANLAREKQVNINYEKLKAVKVTLIPTFTRRFIGFGGRMTAAPLLMQQWDWTKEYLPEERLP